MRGSVEKRRESAVLSQARRLLEMRNGHCYKTGGLGEPDLICCQAGVSIVVECKQPGEKPKPLQRLRLQEWALAGALAFWFDGTWHRIGFDGREIPGSVPPIVTEIEKNADA